MSLDCNRQTHIKLMYNLTRNQLKVHTYTEYLNFKQSLLNKIKYEVDSTSTKYLRNVNNVLKQSKYVL